MTVRIKVSDALWWMFSMFCLSSGFAFMPSLGAVLLLFVGIASMPLRVLRHAWGKLPEKLRFLKPLVLTLLFLVAVFIVPLPEEIEENGQLVTEEGGSLAAGDVEVSGGEESSASDALQGEEASDAINTSESSKSQSEKPTGEGVEADHEKVATLSPEETALNIKAIIAEGLPPYEGEMFVVIHDNVPYFTEEEMTTISYEYYSPLDELERCGPCVASIGQDIMPTQERGDIGHVKPSGWKQAKYTGVVDGSYLYNRAHLIGHQLTGEDANVCNLITGTRYFNTEGMLPFENMVADYVKETGNHVMYRVTPVFEGDNLLATGVLMEAKSVEDDGEGVLFCVYCYNVQPGIYIDYSDGTSTLQEDAM